MPPSCEALTMASATHLQTLSSDRLYQQLQFKEAVSLVTEQDTDLVIVSKDKQRLPCHSSLLALYSPVVAKLNLIVHFQNLAYSYLNI